MVDIKQTLPFRADPGNTMATTPTVARALLGSLILLLSLLLLPLGSQAQEAICARVKIEIQQELTLERQAFDAHMRINNGLDNLTLENVNIEVNFTDENRNPVIATSDPNNTSAKFFIRLDRMSGLTNISGSGTVPPASSADVHWLIIPAAGTGGQLSSGQLYYVGATLRYTLGGEQQVTEVTPDYIFVKPLPLLTLDYFLTQDVVADDAFTLPIEPAEPFTLGVRVFNKGQGVARNLKIDSAQPRIIENEQGLLINFQILGSYVNDLPTTPSLLINFGDIRPQTASVGRWQMITTLSGQFVEFTADFAHADELGGELTSLLQAAITHFLVHDILVDLPGRDAIRDFLAKDGDVLRVYESSGLDTVVTNQSALATLQAAGQSGNQLNYTLTAPPTDGFLYVKLPDPHQGTRPPSRALRADGKLLPLDNVWLSRQRRADKRSWDYFINLFDANSPGRYQLSLGEPNSGPQPPVMQYIPDRSVAVGQPIGFLVEASDPNGTVPALAAAPLPVGARFTDRGDGSGIFSWTPTAAQTGVYPITFAASDGALQTAQVARITVIGFEDSDDDELPDDWEREKFGNLDRDGSGDYDGDGISDLDEYLNGTDPADPVVVSLKQGFNLFAYPTTVPIKHATCRALLSDLAMPEAITGLERYNPATSQFERCDMPGGTDFPIEVGEAYVLRLKTDKILTFSGRVACTTFALTPGINLVGHRAPPASLNCFSLLQAFGADKVSTIQRFNSTTGAFESCTFFDRGDGTGPQSAGKDFAITTGDGLIVNARGEGTLIIQNCRD
jgi:hypothetical protein